MKKFLHEEHQENTKLHREEKTKTSVEPCDSSVELCERFLHEEHEDNTKLHEEEKL